MPLPQILFRKRPVIVYAYQYKGSGPLKVNTDTGVMVAMPGDWIITGAKGEQFPCTNDIFEATYEPVNEVES